MEPLQYDLNIDTMAFCTFERRNIFSAFSLRPKPLIARETGNGTWSAELGTGLQAAEPGVSSTYFLRRHETLFVKRESARITLLGCGRRRVDSPF